MNTDNTATATMEPPAMTATHMLLVNEYRAAVLDAEKCREQARAFERQASVLLQKIIDRGLTP